MEDHFRRHTPHRVAANRIGKLPALRFFYWGGGPAPTVVQLARSVPDLLGEACLALVSIIDTYPVLDYDRTVFLWNKIKWLIIDEHRRESKHEYALVTCLTCGGKRHTGAEEEKCAVCRGRGFMYTLRIDPVEQIVPDPKGEDVRIREEIDRNPNPEERLLSSESMELLRAEIDRLPDFQRKLVFALYWDGLGETEAARSLSTSQPTVNRRKKDALSSLQVSVPQPSAEIPRVTHRRSSIRDWWGESRARSSPCIAPLDIVKDTLRWRKVLADSPIGYPAIKPLRVRPSPDRRHAKWPAPLSFSLKVTE
jgi:RNA polymerase sigma factor (sigma-70 family)